MTCRWVTVLLICLLTCVQAFAQETIAEQDIVYRTFAGEELRLDFMRPAGEGPFPLVVCIHGGGWQQGSKNSFRSALTRFIERGYAAATVQYRFADTHPFPAQLQDVKCAVIFLKNNAERFKINPERVAAMGNSAGGHLALMLALTRPDDGFESCEVSGADASVSAAVNWFGPTSFPTWEVSEQTRANFEMGFKKSFNRMLEDLVGTSDPGDPRMAAVSPVTYVDSADPPVLTLHGINDKLVPPQQAEILHVRLRAAGVPEQLVLVPDAGHGWSAEKQDESYAVLLQFLDQHLTP